MQVALLERILYICLGLAWHLPVSGPICVGDEISGQGWMLERKIYLLEE